MLSIRPSIYFKRRCLRRRNKYINELYDSHNKFVRNIKCDAE